MDNIIKEDDDKYVESDNNQPGDEIFRINLDISKNIKNMDNSNKSDILRISDLLELFQGPVPIKDRMIIATTNNFDKIKNHLPALIRPGRLTPVQFNYMSWDILNELCIYYFKEHLTCDKFNITIPTSHIIELVHKIHSLNLSFNDFIKELQFLCNNNI